MKFNKSVWGERILVTTGVVGSIILASIMFYDSKKKAEEYSKSISLEGKVIYERGGSGGLVNTGYDYHFWIDSKYGKVKINVWDNDSKNEDLDSKIQVGNNLKIETSIDTRCRPTVLNIYDISKIQILK